METEVDGLGKAVPPAPLLFFVDGLIRGEVPRRDRPDAQVEIVADRLQALAGIVGEAGITDIRRARTCCPRPKMSTR